MLFTLPQFYIAFYCGFSAQTVFDDLYVALYNLAFTSISLIIRAAFEQDVNYILKMDDRELKTMSVRTYNKNFNKTGTEFTIKIQNKQIFIPIVSKNIFYRPRKLYF